MSRGLLTHYCYEYGRPDSGDLRPLVVSATFVRDDSVRVTRCRIIIAIFAL